MISCTLGTGMNGPQWSLRLTPEDTRERWTELPLAVIPQWSLRLTPEDTDPSTSSSSTTPSPQWSLRLTPEDTGC